MAEQHICPKILNPPIRTFDKKPSGILELRGESSLRKKTIYVRIVSANSKQSQLID